MTQEANFKYIKLMTGEEIICKLDQDITNYTVDDMITIQDPVSIKIMRYSKGNNIIEGYILYPWVKFVENDTFKISIRMMVSLATIDKKMRDTYISFLRSERESEETENVPLQEILNNIENNKGIDNAEETPEKSYVRRILH